jgi:hypothetical protein
MENKGRTRELSGATDQFVFPNDEGRWTMDEKKTEMNDTTNVGQRRFPFLTVIATLITLFAFLGLMVLAYHSPNYLEETKVEPKIDPTTKLNDLREKNQAVLEGNPGSGGKMSVSEATARLLGTLKSEKDTLPFPIPEPPATLTPETKQKN